MKSLAAPLALLLAGPSLPAAAAPLIFSAADLVVSVEGKGNTAGFYTDNQAAPLSLFGYSTAGAASAAYVGDLVLPQQGSGANSAISGEYGSSSEGLIQRTGDGHALTIMGYGIDADTFNANPTAYGTAINDPTKPGALGQSGSLSGQSSYIPVSRVVALIGADGSVDTSTQLYDVYNGNNPRSVYSVDGASFYTSGQGISGDQTGGVFYATRGSHAATAVTGQDNAGATQDTRFVTVFNNQLYVSADTKSGSGPKRDYVGTLGQQGALPTGLANGGNGPSQLPGFGSASGTGKLTLTAGQTNGINAGGKEINLSPESFFFANATTLYVADSGLPKNSSATNDSNGSGLGDGGLQKWLNINGAWTLQYTLSAGLNLVANTAAAGTTGLLGLTGRVVGDQVELFATNYTIGDTDQTYLFGISDLLGVTAKPTGESFATLAIAPTDSTFKGVAFAPTAIPAVPEPRSWALMIAGFGMTGAGLRRRRRALAL